MPLGESTQGERLNKRVEHGKIVSKASDQLGHPHEIRNLFPCINSSVKRCFGGWSYFELEEMSE